MHEGLPVGPIHRRRDRARALPLLGRRRKGVATRGAASLPRTVASKSCSSRRPSLLDGYRLAGRGLPETRRSPSRWAYCMAVERALDVQIPPRAQWLRALLLERERIANHLGDLGALGNDAGFAYGLAQFSRLKEDWLRLNDRAFGHRFR